MNKKIKEKISKNAFVIMPLIVLLVLSIAVTNTYFLRLEVERLKTIEEDMVNDAQALEWLIIDSIIESVYVQTMFQTKFISKKLELAICKSFDMVQLENNFNNGIMTQEFYDVLTNELYYDSISPNSEVTYNHNFVLGFKDSIFAIFSSDDRFLVNDGGELNWKEYFEKNYVSEDINKLTIKILSKDLDQLYIIQKNNSLGDNTIISNKTQLKDLYFEYGIEIFRNFDLLLPSYITDNGDIFDNNDYSYLEENDNHKMILIQFINLYDAIKQEVNQIIPTIHKNTIITTSKIDGYVQIKFITCLCLNLILIALGVIFSVIYNSKVE